MADNSSRAAPEAHEYEHDIAPPKRTMDATTAFMYMFPLAIGFAIPTARVALRRNPVVRDRVFYTLLGVGLMHGGWMIQRTYPE